MGTVPDAASKVKQAVDVRDVLAAASLCARDIKPGEKIPCPFHEEKAPSFAVGRHGDDRVVACHCFGCHWHGDAIQLYQELNGVEFMDAIQALADMAGVRIEKDPKAAARAKQRRDREDIYGLVATVTAKWLFDRNGEAALQFLSERGLAQSALREAGIG